MFNFSHSGAPTKMFWWWNNSAILYYTLVLPTAEERTTSGLQATITWILTRSYSPGAQHTPKHFSILQFYWCQVEWLYPTYKFQDWMLSPIGRKMTVEVLSCLSSFPQTLYTAVEHLYSGELNHWSSAKIGFVSSSPPVMIGVLLVPRLSESMGTS